MVPENKPPSFRSIPHAQKNIIRDIISIFQYIYDTFTLIFGPHWPPSMDSRIWVQIWIAFPDHPEFFDGESFFTVQNPYKKSFARFWPRARAREFFEIFQKFSKKIFATKSKKWRVLAILARAMDVLRRASQFYSPIPKFCARFQFFSSAH